MARRGTKQAEAQPEANENEATETEAPDTEVTDEVTEDNTEAADEATEDTDESSDSEDKKEKDEKVVDLTAFKDAAVVAVDGSDESTGSISVAELEKVLTEYRALDGIKPKNKAKGWLNEQMKEAMNESNIQRARAFLQLHEGMTAGAKPAAERVPADPTEAFVQRSTVLKLAQSLLTPGEGVSEDWEEKADKLFDELKADADRLLEWTNDQSEDKGEEPEVNSLARNAVKLSLGKSAKTGKSNSGGTGYTGERRDIGKHITEAFADQPVGTFLTVAEIRKFQSTEYGTDLPSAGAISARLFPQGDASKNTVKGVKSGTNEKGNKGAEKVDAEA